MEVFVGTFVHATEDKPMLIMIDHVMGVLNSNVSMILTLLFFVNLTLMDNAIKF